MKKREEKEITIKLIVLKQLEVFQSYDFLHLKHFCFDMVDEMLFPALLHKKISSKDLLFFFNLS